MRDITVFPKTKFRIPKICLICEKLKMLISTNFDRNGFVEPPKKLSHPGGRGLKSMECIVNSRINNFRWVSDLSIHLFSQIIYFP